MGTNVSQSSFPEGEDPFKVQYRFSSSNISVSSTEMIQIIFFLKNFKLTSMSLVE